MRLPKNVFRFACLLLIVNGFFCSVVCAGTASLGQFLPDAIALYKQGRFLEAAKTTETALHIAEHDLPPNHPGIAMLLNLLAGIYKDQGLQAENVSFTFEIYYRALKFAHAESLYKRALSIREQILRANHPDLATTLNDLGLLYYYQKKYDAAEMLCKRAIAINTKALRPAHPYLATSINNLALIYHAKKNYAAAEPLYKKAIAIYEKNGHSNNHLLASALNNLAGLYRDQQKYETALPLDYRALEIATKELGPKHPTVLAILKNIVQAHFQMEKRKQ